MCKNISPHFYYTFMFTVHVPYNLDLLLTNRVFIYLCNVGEMWVGITLAVVVELVPSEIKTTAVAAYLFIISNIGGNANLLVPPLAQHFENQNYSKSDSLRCMYYQDYSFISLCNISFKTSDK